MFHLVETTRQQLKHSQNLAVSHWDVGPKVHIYCRGIKHLKDEEMNYSIAQYIIS